MTKKIKIDSKEYRQMMRSAQDGYKELKRGAREDADTYTAKVWADAVIGNLYRLGIIDFQLDLTEIPYESLD